MLVKSGFTYQTVDPYAFNKEIVLIKQIVNGLIGFGDLAGDNRNMFGLMAQVDFPLANTDVEIDHNLNTVPIGYLILRNSNGGVVYDGVGNWTKTSIFLRSTTANNSALIFILG